MTMDHISISISGELSVKLLSGIKGPSLRVLDTVLT